MGQMVVYMPQTVTERMGEESRDCGDLWFDQANTCLIHFYKKYNVEPREPDISEENCVEVSRENYHNTFDRFCKRIYLECCKTVSGNKCRRMFSGMSVWISLTS